MIVETISTDRANLRLVAACSIVALCVVLLSGQACAVPATTGLASLQVADSSPNVSAWLDRQLRLVTAWWQIIEIEWSAFPNGPVLAAASARVADQPLLFSAIAVAVCMFPTLFWIVLRRRRVTALVPASLNDLDGIYRQYEHSDSVPRRSRRGGAAATGDIGDTKGRAPLHGLKSGANQPLGWLDALDKGFRIALTEPTIKIGRHSSNFIVLDDTTVHRYHATLELNQRGLFELQDLGGVNGTFVNGTRCQLKELVDGDILQLGAIRMRFKANPQIQR